jgi:hypothetical protein
MLSFRSGPPGTVEHLRVSGLARMPRSIRLTGRFRVDNRTLKLHAHEGASNVRSHFRARALDSADIPVRRVEALIQPGRNDSLTALAELS